MLELGRAVDLAGDQHAAVDKQRGHAPLDHFDALVLERAAAQSGQLEHRLVGHRDPPLGPHERMHDHRQTARAASPDQSRQAACMVEVPVAEH